ncbi:HMA domain-containing protein [Fusarium sp. LHS14.1]|nr:HMA domain-containing protein [Fusarium sp. LHS14.1]
MACCAVAAYVVFRFLRAYEKLLGSIKPPHDASKINHVERPVLEVTTGHSPKQHQVHVFNLDGLTCGSCVTALRTTIEEIPGVLQASASLALLRARVTASEAVTQTTILNAIRSAGYGADPAPVSNSHGWANLLSSIQAPLDNRRRNVLAYRRDFAVSALASLMIPLIHCVSGMLQLGPDPFIDLTLCVAIAVSLVASSGIHIESARAIWHLRKPDMSTLGSLGILLSSTQGVSRAWAANQSGTYRFYHPASDSIPILSSCVLGSRLLKNILTQRSLDFGSPLANLIPATATICRDASGEDPITEPIDMVSPGDFVVVDQGQHIPADGIVVSTDSALITEAWLNGSNLPRTVRLGDAVFAGCRVEHGTLVLSVKSCGLSTRLGAMMGSVVSGELKPQESPLDSAVQYFTTAVIIFAAAVCAAQGFSLPEGSLTEMLGQASSVMLAACPCALSLSVPTCKLLATVRASKAGIRLVTTYSRFKDVAGIRTLLFDKTGTLTHGDLRVRYVSLATFPPLQSTLIWRAIWELEKDVRHPVAHAIVRESLRKMDGLGAPPPTQTTSDVVVSEVLHELGRGVQGTVTSTSSSSKWHLAIGSRKFIESLGVHVDFASIPADLRCAVTTPVVVAINGMQVGVLVFGDVVRSEAIPVIKELKKIGVKIGMITGDNAASANAVSRQVGIDADMVFANSLPRDKADAVAWFRRHGPVLVVGDNLNDLPCFMSASFSVCIPGQEMAFGDFDAADATLTPFKSRDSELYPELLRRIPFLVYLSRHTVKVVSQNMWWAAAYNALSLLWASGVIGSTKPLSSVWFSLGMGFSSAVVLLNSSRIGRESKMMTLSK